MQHLTAFVNRISAETIWRIADADACPTASENKGGMGGVVPRVAAKRRVATAGLCCATRFGVGQFGFAIENGGLRALSSPLKNPEYRRSIIGKQNV